MARFAVFDFWIRVEGEPLAFQARGPEVLLCSAGITQVGNHSARFELSGGESVFVPSSEKECEVFDAHYFPSNGRKH